MKHLRAISSSIILIVPIIINTIMSRHLVQTHKGTIPTRSEDSKNLSRDYFEGQYDTSTGSRTRRHIIVATLESAPFMMKRYNSDNSTFEWYGYCMDLFLELVKHLPYEITYEIYQVSDNKFGSKSKLLIEETAPLGKENRTTKIFRTVEKWNGLIGDIYSGKANLALAPLAVMAERELAVDFTVPFYDLVGIQILLKKPEVPQDWFKFLTVLDGEVWFSVTLAYFVTSVVMFLFDRLSPYSHKNLTRIKKLRERRGNGDNADKTFTPHEGTKTKANHLFDNNSNKSSNISEMASKPTKAQEKTGEINPLVRSHQLFIGSLSQSKLTEQRRKSSLLFFTGLDFMTNKRSSSVFPNNDSGYTAPLNQLQGRNSRGSNTLSDYFRSIDIGRNGGAWNGDDAESSENEEGKPDFGLRDSLWFCITSLTPQGGGEAPQNLSGRVVAGAWWLFCFIIIASYTANLAAFLTVSRLDIPIESLDDLVKQYRIKYAPVDGTAEQTYFERMAYIEEIFYKIWKDMSLNDTLSEDERLRFAVWDYPISDKYTKIWAQIQQVGMPHSAEEGIQRVKSSNLDDGFALLADANMVKHAVMTDCSFKAVADEFSRKPIALGVRKGDDQFRDDLSYAILQLINQRYMEILRERWWTNNPSRVTCDNNDESEGISIENIGGVFIIIFAGVALSFFVWAVERFIYKTKIGVSQELIQKL